MNNVNVINFTRLWSSNVLMQAHASPDSRFVILPIIEERSRITGWLVYDAERGELLTAPDTSDEPWTQLHEARRWVLDTFYKESTG